MNESSEFIFFKDVATDTSAITQKILNFCYLSIVKVDIDGGKFLYSGRTQIEDAPILVSVNLVEKQSGKAKLAVSSENTVLNSRLLKALKTELQ